MKKYILFILCSFVLFSCGNVQDKKVQEPDPFIYKSGSLEKGETLAKAMLKEDLDNVMVYKLVNKLDSIYNLRRSHPGDSFLVKIDTLNVIHELVYIPNKINKYRVIKDTNDVYYTQIDTLKLTKAIQHCNGEITTSLYQAMIDAGEGGALPVMFTQIFQWDIDFFIDPQKGDRFNLIYEQYMDGDKFVKYGEMLSAQYKSKNYSKIAYFYTNKKGISKYYDEKGVSFQKAFLKSPLNYRRITSYFGNRTHPITRKVRLHNGVDYAAAYGTPVEASADGTIIHRGWKGGHPTINGRTGGYGKTIMIRHGNGYKTLYGHLSKYGKYKVGNRVEQHDIIGYVGSTGLSTGNHLHYTIYYHDKAINPLKLNNVSGPPVPKNEMKEFKIEVERLRTLLLSDITYASQKKEVTEIESEVVLSDTNSALNDSKDKSNGIVFYLISIIVLLVLVIIRLIMKIDRLKKEKIQLK